jgi:iron complex outermembrane receptor protein
MRRLSVAVLLGLAMTTQGFAQSKATVSGDVKDHNGKALQSVTVSLLEAKDSSLVKADVTDGEGKFQIALYKSGKFLLSYSILGYEKNFLRLLNSMDRISRRQLPRLHWLQKNYRM